jgi:hypothetical protein
MEINYYIFDKIEGDGQTYTGYLGNNSCEVFPLSSQDTEKELEENGFAKCDAPGGTETFVVEESAWQGLSAENNT